LITNSVSRRFADFLGLIIMSTYYNGDDYPFQEECHLIIGITMEIHRILGKGFSDIVYKDAFEYELLSRGISYEGKSISS